VIGGAGVLTALVPGSIILIAASTLFANDIWRGLTPQTSDATVARIARCAAPVIVLIAVALALSDSQTIAALLLLGYGFVTQMFPAVIGGLMAKNPVTKAGAFAGIIVGVATVFAITISGRPVTSFAPFLPTQFNDVNVGFFGLILNMIVTGVVSLATRPATVAGVERA